MAPRRKKVAVSGRAKKRVGPPAVDEAARVRHLIALDAQAVLTRLQSRQEAMVGLFSRLRDRGPLLSTLQSHFSSIGFSQLACLKPHEQLAVARHYELLFELTWYAQYTEDMPGTVQQRLQAYVAKLEQSHRALVAVLGPADGGGGPVVEPADKAVHSALK